MATYHLPNTPMGSVQRLGKNLGCYRGECIDIDSLQSEIDTLAVQAGWVRETFLDVPGKWLSAYKRLVTNPRKRIYLSAGIHGDEPSGPMTLLQLLRENRWPHDMDIWLVPCLNPSGYRANTRESDEGIDLNRDYRHFRSIEVRSHVAWFEQQPNFDLSFHLHEDWEANGFYVYEVNPFNHFSFAQPVLDRVLEVCPIETSSKVDGWECEGGVIRPQIKPADRPEWAEALYLISNKSAQSYTLETPSDFPLSLRIAAHHKAVHAILNLAKEF